MARDKPCSHEEMEQMKRKAAQRKTVVEASTKEKAAKANAVQSGKPPANAKNKDSSVMGSEATRVAVASSSKHLAEDTLSISEEILLSKQTKVSEHLKAIQAKQHAQQQIMFYSQI